MGCAPELADAAEPSARRPHSTPRRTTPCCSSPSAGPRSPTTWCRSSATSPRARTSPTRGWRRSASTTTSSAGAARSTTRTAPCSPRSESDLAANGIDLPVYWGNRNWDPYLTDASSRWRRTASPRAACLVTSAYSSYSGCRQYREDLADGRRRACPARRGSTGCGTTSTTRASSSRWSTPPWPRWPSCPRTPDAAGTWRS